MKHFLYTMNGDQRAPAGDSDVESWFHYYKWEELEGEVFVPVARTRIAGLVGFFGEHVQVGDMLWFAMNGKLYGGAPVLRVEVEESQGLVELWYDVATIVEVDDVNGTITRVEAPLPTNQSSYLLLPVPDLAASEYLRKTHPRVKEST
jgi:hypothetical protein